MERTQARIALVDGAHTAVWMRIPDLELGGPTLGVAGDYVPLALRHALGDGWSTHSLDNTLRVVAPPGDGWVLADVVIDGAAGGFGSGHVTLWDGDGALLGSAGQSFTCRRRAD
jgi:acyl-CoA thioesterase